MGIVESSWRKQVRVGEEVDITLIGGREMRGRVLDIAEDGLLLGEENLERPIAFAGIATFALTRCVRREKSAPQGESMREEAPPAQEMDEPQAEQPADAAQEAPVHAEGWIDRYDAAAGVGSLALNGGGQALFVGTEIADEALAERLGRWTGRALPAQATVRVQNGHRVAEKVALRETEEKFRPRDVRETLPREGFGEIVHYDKVNGYGKAKEGNVKFLFRREDIASGALWQEILRSENTCGIKVAFTVTADEKGPRYGRVREIAALVEDGALTPPDFAGAEGAPRAGEASRAGDAPRAGEPARADDNNPQARVTFTDGTTMEESVRTGALMFYNPDKFFGRLRAENGERFYFRASDVMQLSLLDFLNARSALDIEETLVTFSIKRLPTGKLAAGRVSWPQKGGPDPEPKEDAAPAGEDAPEAEAPVAAGAAGEADSAPAGKAAAALDAYCAAYLRAWGGEEDALRGHLLLRAEEAARDGDAQSAQDLLLECAALSDARREKRDEAMLAYLRCFASEDAGEDLPSFLAQATYGGVAMFDALTRLYAAAEGAMGRLCGILCEGKGMVTLRAELLRRFGQVPETAQELRAAWQPLVAGERARTDYAAWPLDEAGLQKADPEGAHPEWKEVLAACLAPAGQAARLLRAREEILRRPLRPAVAYLLPAVLDAQAALQQESGAKVSLRALGRVRVLGQDYAALEVAGQAEAVCVELAGARAEVGDLSGEEAIAFPFDGEEGEARVTGRANGQDFCEAWALAFPAAVQPEEEPIQLLAEKGAVAFVDGAQALAAIEAAALGDAECILVRAGAFFGQDEAAGAEAAILGAMQAEMDRRFGPEVTGLLSFPYAGEAPEADALERVLRDFADVRLLHDKLKGAHILVTASARGGAEEALCALCARMAGPSVHAALDVEEAPEGANLFVARGGQAGVAEALRRGGFAAERVILAETAENAAAEESAQPAPDAQSEPDTQPAPESAAEAGGAEG